MSQHDHIALLNTRLDRANSENERLRADLAKAQKERDELLKALRYANDRLQPVESSLAKAKERIGELEKERNHYAEIINPILMLGCTLAACGGRL